MAKHIVGYVSAYIRKEGLKTQYPRIGTLFQDDGDGRFSMKLDSIPVDKAWEGWCNVFPPYAKKTEKENADEFAAPPTETSPDSEGDVPF